MQGKLPCAKKRNLKTLDMNSTNRVSNTKVLPYRYQAYHIPR